MYTGKVKWFNDAKGYGFIDVNGENVFAHYTQIKGDGFLTLAEEQTVKIDAIIHDKTGASAMGITKVLR